MSAIGPGDWVECVDASGANNGGMFDGGFLVAGRVYQVRALSTLTGGAPGVKLVGQPDIHLKTGKRGSYSVTRFRPIYRPKADLIERLMQPIDEPVKQPA